MPDPMTPKPEDRCARNGCGHERRVHLPMYGCLHCEERTLPSGERRSACPALIEPAPEPSEPQKPERKDEAMDGPFVSLDTFNEQHEAVHAWMERALEAEQAVEVARAALMVLADRHHTCLTPSKLHDPERLDWRECRCMSCKFARIVADGIESEAIREPLLRWVSATDEERQEAHKRLHHAMKRLVEVDAIDFPEEADRIMEAESDA